MAIWFTVDDCNSSLVRQLHQYWASKRGDRRLPRRADVDPGEIKDLLPYILIADLVGELPRVRYRLVGTKVAAASGIELTGHYLDEFVAGDVENEWQDYYGRVRDDARPLFGNATVPRLDGELFRYEFGLFPLTTSGTAVGQCIAIEDYFEMNDRMYELRDKTQPWHLRPIRPKTT